MVYEVEKQRYVLTERSFGDYPFLLLFALQPGKGLDFRRPNFSDVPDEVIKATREVCERTAQTIQLPKKLHNIEADVTEPVRKYLTLPKGWDLTKAIMKINIGPGGIPGVSCDCDVDGPCGYCCDTCDCNSCYNCC
jgi:hypothetical protein